MRISDWSSDVCSSDLVDADALLFGKRAKRLVERDRQADGVADQPKRPSPPRQRSAVSENGGRLQFLGRREEATSVRHTEEWRKSWKSGRAPGRERGGQYERNSVGVVVLTKQNSKSDEN